jgi:hypothetical protein
MIDEGFLQATDEIWASVIEKKPVYRKSRGKSLPYWKELAELFNGNLSTGLYSQILTDNYTDSQLLTTISNLDPILQETQPQSQQDPAVKD